MSLKEDAILKIFRFQVKKVKLQLLFKDKCLLIEDSYNVKDKMRK